MDEVKRRISEDSKLTDGVRSPKAWAHYLNNGVKDGLSREGANNVVLRLNLSSKVNLGIVLVDTVMFGSGIDPLAGRFAGNIPDLLSLGREYLIASAIFNGMDRFWRGKSPKLSDKNTRYSLFYGPQVDRAVLLKMLTRMGTYVKATDK